MTAHERLREIEERVAGHTPGPWRADGILCWTTNKPTERYDDWVFGDDIVAEEADSALIAAAPDLLAIAGELDAELQEAVRLLTEVHARAHTHLPNHMAINRFLARHNKEAGNG